MSNENYDTLSQAVNALHEKGYTEDFEAKEDYILANYSKKEYQPEDLKVVNTFRFEGITDPADEATVLVIEANDGAKGVVVMSFNSQHNQNEDLIKRIAY